MPAISRLIAVAPPGDMLESLRFAFERDGTEISFHDGTDGPDHIAGKLAAVLSERDGDETVRGHDVIIASSQSRAAAEALLRELRAVVKAAPVRIPIVYLGNELSVDAGIAAGANAVLSQPLFVRDVVVATGLVARRRRADLARGDLNDFDGLFYIVRALTQFKRSAVLTVVRGLRRGEIRFFEGQATSAQIGPLHGLSALHHLMLWHVGTFELRFEHVVQRQQIPLATDELFTDVQRFLAEVHETAHLLSFVGSYETNDKHIADVIIPDEIREVLDLMDGSRTLPDIVEDSPYRMFETLRIANRLLELQLVRHVAEISSDFGFKMRRRVEEMALSSNAGIPDVVSGDETGRTVKLNQKQLPAAKRPESPAGKRAIDWSDVMPGSPSKDDKLAQVVPAWAAAGEITVANQEAAAEAALANDLAGSAPAEERAQDASGKNSKPRPEQLETFTSAEERDRLFALGEAPVGSKQTARPDESASAENGPAENEPAENAPAEIASDERVADTTSQQSDSDQAPAATAERAGTPGTAAPSSNSQLSGHFSDDEEAFFQAGRDIETRKPPPVESFDDLDEGYQPVSFWQRLFGRRGKRRPAAAQAGRKRTTRQADTPGRGASRQSKANDPTPTDKQRAEEPAARANGDSAQPDADHAPSSSASDASASQKKPRAQSKSGGKKSRKRKKGKRS